MESMVDGRGGRLDLLVRAGSDMPTVTLTFSNDDGTPMNLTGSTVAVAAMTRGDTPVPMEVVATVTDAANGEVSLDFAVAEIGRMTVPSTVTARPLTGGDWTLDVVSAGGRITPVLFGEVLVARGAT